MTTGDQVDSNPPEEQSASADERTIRVFHRRVGKHALSFHKSDLGRNTRSMSAAYLLGYGAQGLYFLILARKLGPSGLGLFAGALAVVSIIAPFSGLGSGQLLLMHTSRDPKRFREQFGLALLAIGVTGSGFIAITGGIAYATLWHRGLGPLLIPLAFSELLFGRIIDLSAQCFQAHDQISSAGKITLSVSLARLVAVLVWVIGPATTSPVSWSWFYLVASAVCGLSTLVIVSRRFGRPASSHDRLRDSVGTSIAFSLGQASKTIYSDIDKAMLTRLSTEAAAGIYTAAYRIVFMAYAPVLAFLYASNVRFYRAGVNGSGAVWRVATKSWPIIAAYAALVGVVLLAASPLMPVILGSRYDASATALRWLCLLPIIMATHSLFGDAMMGLGRQGLRSMLQLTAAGLNVALNLWLIPLYSWRGATVATYVCEGGLALALMVALRRQVSAEPAGSDSRASTA